MVALEAGTKLHNVGRDPCIFEVNYNLPSCMRHIDDKGNLLREM